MARMNDKERFWQKLKEPIRQSCGNCKINKEDRCWQGWTFSSKPVVRFIDDPTTLPHPRTERVSKRCYIFRQYKLDLVESPFPDDEENLWEWDGENE